MRSCVPAWAMSCLVLAHPAAPFTASGKVSPPVFRAHHRTPRHPISAVGPRHLRALVLAAAIALVSAAPVAAQEGQVNSATIQWAQQILDQQGFYQGRASGKMDSATAAAISAYQRKRGLKATGRLDQATIDTLLRDQPERKGVGNLADPSSRAKPSVPILKESEVQPQAAPTAPGVERGSGTENTVLGAVRGGGGAVPDVAARPPAPVTPGASQPAGEMQAAPRSAVEAENIGPREEDRPFDLADFNAPNWARFGLIGVIALVVLGMVVNWWLSGRRRRPGARKAAPPTRRQTPAAGPVRREPTLGGGTEGSPGRREPVFTAPVRDPRRVR